jgi:hypothetical protein
MKLAEKPSEGHERGYFFNVLENIAEGPVLKGEDNP